MTTDQRSDAKTRRWQVLHAYLVLPHATPIIVVLTVTGLIAIVASRGLPSARVFADLLLAMLGGQIAVGAVNELVDASLDAQVKPSKPIPAGLVTPRGAIRLTAISLALMVVFAARLGWDSLALCALGTGTGIAYSVWFKRTIVAWLPYLIALPLLPIWVYSSLNQFDPRLLMLYPLGVFAVIGVYLSQSLPDVAADRATDIDSLTTRLGESRSLTLILGLQLTSVLISVLAAARWTDVTASLVAGFIVIVLSMLVFTLYRVRPRTGVLACFPCVAISTALLGLAWVIGIPR